MQSFSFSAVKRTAAPPPPAATAAAAVQQPVRTLESLNTPVPDPDDNGNGSDASQSSDEPRQRESKRKHKSADRKKSKRHKKSKSARDHDKKQSERDATLRDLMALVVFDTQGDEMNRRYGTLNKFQVLRYARSSGGQVMGLPDMLRIDEAAAKTDKELSIVVRDSESDDEDDDTGKVKLSDDLQRVRDYNTRLQLDPRNVRLWLEFVAFQDVQDDPSQAAGDRLRRGNVEKKLSIFERALRDNSDSEELWCAYINCAAAIWEPEQVLSKYKELLREHPAFYKLTLDYLSYRQTVSASFTIPSCRSMYEDCLENLRDALSAARMHEREELELLTLHIWLRAVSMLWLSGYKECAVAILQAQVDYVFHFPALLERASMADTHESFSLYWESGVAKFGEPGALGWAAFLAGEGSLSGPPSSSDTSTPSKSHDVFAEWVNAESDIDASTWLPRRLIDDELDPYGVVFFEDVQPYLFRIRTPTARKQLLYAVFSVFHMPIPLQRPQSSFTSDALLDNSLLRPQATIQFWQESLPNLPGITLSLDDVLIEEHGVLVDPERGGTITVGKIPAKTFALATDTLMQASVADRQLCPWAAATDADHADHPTVLAFLRNAFQQVCNVPSDLLDSGDVQSLRLLWLAARKMMRQLLKQSAQDLSLWCTYAILECGRGDINEAEQVFLKVLTMKAAFPADQHVYWPLVYLSFAEMEWRAGRPDRALYILVHQADENEQLLHQGVKLAPAVLAKTRKFYQQAAAAVLLAVPPFQNSLTQSIALSPLFAHGLFTYLTKSCDDASNVYRDMLKTLAEAHPEACRPPLNPNAPMYAVRELIYQHWVKVVYVHTQRCSPYQPKLLRAVCDQALQEFPQTSLLWDVFIWNESKMKVDMHMRRVLASAVAKHPSHLQHLIGIYAELHTQRRYNPDLVRRLFIEATDSAEGRHHVGLWKLYILFETRLGATNHARVKSVLYQAIRECPWAKELYMLAYGPCRNFLGLDELYQVWGFMEEKEIRVRKELFAAQDAE
ncbi:hypothetical protein RI367_006194 [Sorochytrium milnesiophthora]